MKDITVEKERNFLRTLGVKVEKGKFKCSMKGRIFAYTIRIATYAVLIVLFLTGLITLTLDVIGISILSLLMLNAVFTVLLVERTDYNHQRDLDFSLVSDISILLLLPLVFVDNIGPPPAGPVAAASMIVYAIVWFIVFNYFTWESFYEPKD